jgi:hypothetical protein
MNVPISADRVRALLGTPPVVIEPYAPATKSRYRIAATRKHGFPKGSNQERLLTWIEETNVGMEFTPNDIPLGVAKSWRSASITLAYLFRKGLLVKLQDGDGHEKRSIYKLKGTK